MKPAFAAGRRLVASFFRPSRGRRALTPRARARRCRSVLGPCLRLRARKLLDFRFGLGPTPFTQGARSRNCLSSGVRFHRTHEVARDNGRQRAAALDRCLLSGAFLDSSDTLLAQRVCAAGDEPAKGQM